MQKDKKKLRSLLRKRRRDLPQADVQQKSRFIFERLQTLPLFQNATTVVSYAADENEVQTEAIWRAAIQNNKAVYYPRFSLDRTNLEFVRRYPNDVLIPGTCSILIPPGNDTLEAGHDKDTVVVTPGVGFDTNGRRLGRGKGYYDRTFLWGALAGAVRVALAYELQIVPTIPSGSRDAHVDWIVTEERWIDCSAKETAKTVL